MLIADDIKFYGKTAINIVTAAVQGQATLKHGGIDTVIVVYCCLEVY